MTLSLFCTGVAGIMSRRVREWQKRIIMSQDLNQLNIKVRDALEAFLVSLQERAAHLIKQPWADIRPEIESLAQSLQEQNAGLVVDEPSKSHLARSSLLLAAYRVLTPLIDDRSLVRENLQIALDDRVKQDVAAYLVERFDISSAMPEQAFERAAVNLKKIGDRKFGRAFIYQQEILTETQGVTVVRKCFFNDFFRANNARELLPLLCAGDELWMNELNQPKYGVRAFRTALLSQGDTVCRFHITRVNSS